MVSSNINQICSLISSTASMSHTSIKIVGLGGIRLLSRYLKVHPFYGACFMQTSPHFELIFRVLMGLVYKIKRFCPLNLTSMNDLERFLDKKIFGTRVCPGPKNFPAVPAWVAQGDRGYSWWRPLSPS